MATATSKNEGMDVIRYDVTDAAIAEIAETYKNADASTTKGYGVVVKGIATTRELRVAVEKKRKDLKRDALDYGRRVDGEAKRITAALMEIEQPLKLLKGAVDDEKELVKREAEEARLAEERAKAEAERAAKEAALKAEREVEEARLAEERKNLEAERAKLDEERKAREAEESERQRKQEAADTERMKKIAEEERILAERKAETEKAEAEQRAREEERAEAARKEREKAEHEARMAEIEKRRLAALPDVEKLKRYAADLLSVVAPKMESSSGVAVSDHMGRKLLEIEQLVDDFAEELAQETVS